MKMFLKLVMSAAFITSMLFNAGVAQAELTADELVKRTADDVLNTIKSDKDIQAGNQQKIFALAEEKNHAELRFWSSMPYGVR